MLKDSQQKASHHSLLAQIFHPLKLRGGILTGIKSPSSFGREIMPLPLPEKLFLPLRQHAGKTSEPVVKVSQPVKKGQLIAIANGQVSAYLHAPTSGRISAIGDISVPHPSGLKAPGIEITVDGLDDSIEAKRLPDPLTLSPGELSHVIDEAGIVGMGGAVFPAAIKLHKSQGKIQTLILNGSECEPYLRADDQLMQSQAQLVIDGARLIQHICGAKEVLVGIEDNKPDAIASMTAAAAPWTSIHVCSVPSRYPMGSAKQLIKWLTGLEVPASGRSSDVGVLMHNVATAKAISEALRQQVPLVSRVVTVAGKAIAQPQNIEALIGTRVADIVEFCGGLLSEPARWVMGGPMMGQEINSLDVPIIKGTGGILALTPEEISIPQSQSCIRCGRCVSACPMGLLPLEMANRSRHDDFSGAEEYGLKDCILCGSCAYVCPSHIPLVHYFQYAKDEIKSRKEAQLKIDFTNDLSAAKQQRLVKEAEAKAAKQKKRKNKTKDQKVSPKSEEHSS